MLAGLCTVRCIRVVAMSVSCRPRQIASISTQPIKAVTFYVYAHCTPNKKHSSAKPNRKHTTFRTEWYVRFNKMTWKTKYRSQFLNKSKPVVRGYAANSYTHCPLVHPPPTRTSAAHSYTHCPLVYPSPTRTPTAHSYTRRTRQLLWTLCSYVSDAINYSC